MNFKPFLYLPFLFSLVAPSVAQPLLTSGDAIRLALKNNYGILTAQTESEIASTNNTLGNAGMLPSIGIVGSGDYAQKNVHQKLSDGTDSNKPDAITKTTKAGVELNWTLFDGGKMFITKNRLAEVQTLGEIRFRQTVLQTISSVTAAYYDMVRQKQQMAAIHKVISYNEERVKILQTGFNAGLTPKNNLLQAQIDLNVYRENAITQQNAIVSAQRELCRLLAANSDSTVFSVPDTIVCAYLPDSLALSQKLIAGNTQIQALQKEVDIARLTTRVTTRELWPQVNLNAGYSVLKNNNNTGSVLHNLSVGPEIGWSVSVPLYQAGNATRQIKVTRMQMQTAIFNLQNAQLQATTDLRNTLTEFRSQRQLLTIETENASLSRENMEIALHRLRLGQSTSLEVRLAQDSYQASLTRLTNFSYNLKLAEVKLKLLVGEDMGAN